MAPLSGDKAPASTFISVDLPAPLCPTSPRHSPAPTARSTPASARTAPKLFATPFRLTICSGCVPIRSSCLKSVFLPVQNRAEALCRLLGAGDDLLGVFQRVLG